MVQARDPLREEGHTKSKTGAISGSTNWAFVQQFFFKKNDVLFSG